jgi:hypothetical protein
MQMFKENINFIIKGYEIIKTIQNKLVEIKSQRLCNNNCINAINKNNNVNNDENLLTNNINESMKINKCSINTTCCNYYKNINAKIFSNMNFSLAIEFSMENFM